jgi:hypothetical protein
MRSVILRTLILICIVVLFLPLAAQEAPPPDAPPGEVTAPVMPDTPPEAEAPAPADGQPPVAVDRPLPPPAPGFRRIQVRAGRIVIPREGTVRFLNGVVLEAEGLTITADALDYLTEEQLATAEGLITVRTEDGTTYRGNVLEFDVRAREWRFRDYSVVYLPGFLGRQFIGSTFLRGEELRGTAEKVHAQDTRVTTCDLPEPHYYLEARSVDIFPGDKLIARDIDFYVLGRRVLRLPWFIMWLRQRQLPFVPTFGQNDYEGYFLRVLYQYVFNDGQLGGIRLDQTEKLGAGVGIDHYYTVPGGYGEAFLYGRQNLKEYVARVNHTQALPADIDLRVTGDIRKNSLFSFQPTTLTSINTQAQRRTQHSNTQLTYIRRLNEGSFSTDNTSANFRYDLNTAGGRLRYSGEYSSYGRLDTPANEELWNRLQWTRRLGFGSMHLRIDQRTDVDGDNFTGDDNFSGLQRLPEVYLETDHNQLQWNLLKRLPSQLTMGWGVFDEQPNNVRLNRYFFNWRAQPKAVTAGRTTLLPYGSLRQTLYGDPDVTAMYVINGGLEARTPFGSFTNIFNYRNNQYHGFTPFRFDAAYPAETISEGIQCITKSTRWFINAGKDLQNDRWQDLLFRSEATLTPAFRMTHAVAYDLNNGQWRDLVSQFRYGRSDVISLGVDSRYDMEGERLRRVSTNLSWVINPKWKVQWLGGYDGPSKRLLYNEILLSRDLHCWDVSAYYSYQQKYFYLYFRLKALDIPLPMFGIGRGGQLLTGPEGVPL